MKSQNWWEKEFFCPECPAVMRAVAVSGERENGTVSQKYELECGHEITETYE